MVHTEEIFILEFTLQNLIFYRKFHAISSFAEKSSQIDWRKLH